MPLTIFAKRFTLDVRQGSEYASESDLYFCFRSYYGNEKMLIGSISLLKESISTIFGSFWKHCSHFFCKSELFLKKLF